MTDGPLKIRGEIEGGGRFGYRLGDRGEITTPAHLRLGVIGAFRKLTEGGRIPRKADYFGKARVYEARRGNRTLEYVIAGGGSKREGIEYSTVNEEGTEKRGIKIVARPYNLFHIFPVDPEDWTKGPFTTSVAAFNFVARKDSGSEGRMEITELTPIDDHREVQAALEEMQRFADSCCGIDVEPDDGHDLVPGLS